MLIHSLTGRLRGLMAAAILLLPAAVSVAAAPEPARPQATVAGFHDTLLEIMKNAERLGFEGRYDKLAPVIRDQFDTPLIARVILGRYWGQLGEDQQQQFIEIFTELSTATYASRFDSYDGESFEYLDTQSLNKERVLVRTRLNKADGEAVKFDYLMHQRDGKWYIMSVVAQGVNDLSLKRAEYTSIFEEKGFDGLVTELRNKIAALKPRSDTG